MLYRHLEFGENSCDDDFNLRIPNEQFNKRIGVFRLLCRDIEYITGELFFKDAAAQLKLSNDYISTAVVLVTSPPDVYQEAWAARWEVAIIHTSGLADFVNALQQAKRGEPVHYRGSSRVLMAAFAPRVDSREIAKAIEADAIAAERRGDWAEAERLWRVHIENRPDAWQSHLALARALRAQSRATEAGEALCNAWGRFPGQPDVAARAANYAEETGNWDEAFRIWAELIRRFPDKWVGHQGYVQSLTKAGREDEASQYLELHSKSFPNDVGAVFQIAQLAERKSDWMRAESAWTLRISLPGAESWHYLRLYRALRNQRKTTDANRVLQEALGRFPTDDKLALDVAVASASYAEETGNWEEALKIWEELIRRHPDRWIGYRGYLWALSRSGRHDDADHHLEVYSKSFPNDPDAVFQIAQFAERKLDWPRVEQAWKMRISLPHAESWHYLRLHRALLEQKKNAEAHRLLHEALNHFPTDQVLVAALMQSGEGTATAELKAQ